MNEWVQIVFIPVCTPGNVLHSTLIGWAAAGLGPPGSVPVRYVLRTYTYPYQNTIF